MTEKTKTDLMPLVLGDAQPVAAVFAQQLPVTAIVKQLSTIQEVMTKVMVVDVDYGKPSWAPRPFLYKNGADVLCLAFGLRPELSIEREEISENRIFYRVKVRLRTKGMELLVGEAFGSCSSLESKYRWRKHRVCPECGEQIRKSKKKPEWYCWEKMGGCGKTFGAEDPKITDQPGKIENADPHDLANTILQMAEKRAYVQAVRRATGAGRLFGSEGGGRHHQDVEPIHRDQFAEIEALAGQLGLGATAVSDRMREVYGTTDAAALTYDQARDLISKLGGKVKSRGTEMGAPE